MRVRNISQIRSLRSLGNPGSPTIRDFNNAHKVHIKEACKEALHITSMHGSNKDHKFTVLEITTSEKKDIRLLHPYTNALVIPFLVENINLHKILITNYSSTNIMFSQAWKALKFTHLPRPVTKPFLICNECKRMSDSTNHNGIRQ